MTPAAIIRNRDGMVAGVIFWLLSIILKYQRILVSDFQLFDQAHFISTVCFIFVSNRLLDIVIHLYGVNYVFQGNWISIFRWAFLNSYPFLEISGR